MNVFKKIVSVILIIGSLGGFMSKDYVSSVILLLLGVMIYPSISEKIKSQFKPWNKKALRYGVYLLLFIVSGSFLTKQSNLTDRLEENSKITSQKYLYPIYEREVETNIEKLTSKERKSREAMLSRLTSTKIYSSLVDSSYVDKQYLPILTAINNGVRSAYINTKGEELFTIEESLVKSFNNDSEKGEDKMDFIISSISLSTPNKGGFPVELIRVFDNYRQKFGLYGKQHDLTGVFGLLEPKNSVFLNSLYEANSKISSWFPENSRGKLITPHIATLSAYKMHVKKYYPKSPYVLNVDKEVSASEIYKDYEKNEVKADNTYKGKKVAVTGKVGEISKDFLNRPFIEFKTGYLKAVRCNFDKKYINKLADLKKGQSVTIIGTCDGLNLMSVVIKDCKLN